MTIWHDISTAPKDRVILATDGSTITTVRWYESKHGPEPSSWVLVVAGEYAVHLDYFPKLWTECPEIPKNEVINSIIDKKVEELMGLLKKNPITGGVLIPHKEISKKFADVKVSLETLEIIKKTSGE